MEVLLDYLGKMKNNFLKLFVFVCLFLVLVNSVSALSNESIQARKTLEEAEDSIDFMLSREIPIERVNETYQEALQLYEAQLALEQRNGRADYKLVLSYVDEIKEIKETAVQAQDELRVFNDTYQEAKKETDLSEFEEEYKTIINSFYEERFEETRELINNGYEKISEIQSSQTATNAFYASTSKTLKNFFKENWLKILIILIIVIILLIVFWNTLAKLKLKLKLTHLVIKKKAVKGLINNLQRSYFKKRDLSEAEYKIKIEKYKEIIRDIDRQTMIVNEELYKRRKK